MINNINRAGKRLVYPSSNTLSTKLFFTIQKDSTDIQTDFKEFKYNRKFIEDDNQDPIDYILPPMACYSCSKRIMRTDCYNLLRQNIPLSEALDMVGYERNCCRRQLQCCPATVNLNKNIEKSNEMKKLFNKNEKGEINLTINETSPFFMKPKTSQFINTGSTDNDLTVKSNVKTIIEDKEGLDFIEKDEAGPTVDPYIKTIEEA